MNIADKLEQASCTFPSETIQLMQEASWHIRMLETLRDDNIAIMEENTRLMDFIENVYRSSTAGSETHFAIKELLGLDNE